MKILVTGGSGSIGTFVTEELERRGHRVTVFDLYPPRNDDVTFIEGDITDNEVIEQAVRTADTVVHMAAILLNAEQQPRLAEQVNVGGLLNVLETAAEADCRVVYFSSRAVFGAISGRFAHPRYEALGEDAPKEPLNVYGTTKLCGEHYCRIYSQSTGLETAIVRLASTFGPGKDDGGGHENIATVSNMIKNSVHGEHVTVSGGDQQNDFIYYQDIARGVAQLVETKSWSYPAYHFGTGSLYTLHDIADAVRDIHPQANIVVREGMNFHQQDVPVYCRMDISRAQADLGFEPAYPPSKAVRHFSQHLQKG